MQHLIGVRHGHPAIEQPGGDIFGAFPVAMEVQLDGRTVTGFTVIKESAEMMDD